MIKAGCGGSDKLRGVDPDDLELYKAGLSDDEGLDQKLETLTLDKPLPCFQKLPPTSIVFQRIISTS